MRNNVDFPQPDAPLISVIPGANGCEKSLMIQSVFREYRKKIFSHDSGFPLRFAGASVNSCTANCTALILRCSASPPFFSPHSATRQLPGQSAPPKAASLPGTSTTLRCSSSAIEDRKSTRLNSSHGYISY